MAGDAPRRLALNGVRTRTTVAAMLVVGVALVLGAVFLVNRQQASLTSVVETGARLRAIDLASALKDGSLPDDVAVPTEDEAFAQIVDSAGKVVRASPNIGDEPCVVDLDPDAGETDSTTVQNTPVGDDPFRVVATTVSVDGQRYSVYVGASLEPVENSLRGLVQTLVAGVVMLVLLVGATTWFVVGRALRPVEQIRAEVDRITGTDLRRRVPEPNVDDEIGRLARTMNSMLARVQDATDRQRRFVGDASHEMRSPLTAMRAQLEVDLAHPGAAEWETTEAEVLAETLRLQRLVDDLLLLARADAPREQRSWRVLDLDDLVLSEVRKLRVRNRCEVNAREVTAVQVHGDSDSLVRAVHNLVSNAERYATSEVTVSLTAVDGTAELRVSDDGPGVPDGLREEIFERFSRGDDSRARDSGGAGLGLAISREIAAAHGGTLTLAPRSPDGPMGATFCLTLPSTD